MVRKLTIKEKIMLWYTLLLISLVCLLFPFLYFTLRNNMYYDAKVILHSYMLSAKESMEYENGKLRLDKDLNLISSDTHAVLYSTKNEIIAGRFPNGFYEASGYHKGGMYEINTGGNQWLVYDFQIKKEKKVIGWVRAVKSLDPIEDTLGHLRDIYLVMIPLYLLFALVGGYFVTRRALFPISQITKTARQISTRDLKQRIHLQGPADEIGTLADTFDEMLNRLEESFNREKRFTSDVSHELRTPTASIMISAEEALNGEKSGGEYRDTLRGIYRESRKMRTMIAQLLMIARSAEGNCSYKLEKIDVSMLTEAVMEEIAETRTQKDVSLQKEIDKGIVLTVEQTLFMRLIINLVDNALKYNRPGGWVRVSLKQKKDSVFLVVEDNGIGISEQDLPKIWDRFYKADAVRIDSSPGLGLSIVKWIVELHGGTISVKSRLGKGSRFEVVFHMGKSPL